MGAGVFYRIDSARVSLREYGWGARSPLVLLAAILKVLRVGLPSSTDDPCVESLAPFEVEALPPDVEAGFAPALAALAACGFETPVYHLIADDLHRTRTILATARHWSGRAWARVHRRTWSQPSPPRDKQFVEFVSELHGGGFLWSLSSSPDLAAPPSCRILRAVGAAPAALWQAHEQALRGQVIRGVSDIQAAVERHHAAVRDFHLQRGVFVPLSPAEQALPVPAEEAGLLHPEVLSEVRRLERGRSGGAGPLILLLSLALFAGAGGGSGWSLASIAILVPVILFHEAGHYVAMRAFGYRNLQMFFIPFFGAAVTGQHYNVPGWKKAVVSLMGPVPGVMAGGVLGIAGLVLDAPLLREIALYALALNGFNLLPLLPLDGGWVMQAVLFSRHPLLEMLFRGSAVLGLLGLGVLGGDVILGLLGLLTLLGMPAAWRVARITGDLRAQGLEPSSPDAQTIPAASADAIAGRVKEAFPAPLSPALAAQHTLQVFETLNARPPGVLASLALLAVQGGAFAAAIVLALLVILGPGFRSAGRPPTSQNAKSAFAVSVVCPSVGFPSPSSKGDASEPSWRTSPRTTRPFCTVHSTVPVRPVRVCARPVRAPSASS